MATVPVKSQPLHNFNFSFLNWGNHGTSTDQPELESDPEPPLPPPHTRIGSRSSRAQPSSFTPRKIRKQRKQHQEEHFVDLEEERPVFPTNSRKLAAGDEKVENKAAEEEDLGKRQWNLRPRKAESLVTVAIGKQSEIAVAAPKSMRLRGFAENGLGFGERKEKKSNKLWIALSREEIEEDIYSMTESRPSRRPKKRPKNVQKQLDSVFPGLWLVGTSADSYRIADSTAKK